MQNTLLHFPVETVAIFVGLSVIALLLDLFAHRKDHVISLKNAALWSVLWIFTALIFAGYLYYRHGPEVTTLFLTGYALEKVLSIDNLFLIMAVFSWFKIPQNYRHRVLYWGIIGAIVFRGIMVAIGTSLLALGPWVEILFAVVVAWSAVMMLRKSHDHTAVIEDYSNHPASRLVKRFFPVWPKLHGHQFMLSSKTVEDELKKPENRNLNVTLKKGAIYVTPLFLCMAVIELSDIMFAFDSVPVIIAVSYDPLIVYSAMMFAIFGLRTMYFLLEALKNELIFLEKAVIFLLFVVALKLTLSATDHIWNHGYVIEPNISLYIVLFTLIFSIIASIVFQKKSHNKQKK